MENQEQLENNEEVKAKAKKAKNKQVETALYNLTRQYAQDYALIPTDDKEAQQVLISNLKAELTKEDGEFKLDPKIADLMANSLSSMGDKTRKALKAILWQITHEDVLNQDLLNAKDQSVKLPWRFTNMALDRLSLAAYNCSRTANGLSIGLDKIIMGAHKVSLGARIDARKAGHYILEGLRGAKAGFMATCSAAKNRVLLAMAGRIQNRVMKRSDKQGEKTNVRVVHENAIITSLYEKRTLSKLQAAIAEAKEANDETKLKDLEHLKYRLEDKHLADSRASTLRFTNMYLEGDERATEPFNDFVKFHTSASQHVEPTKAEQIRAAYKAGKALRDAEFVENLDEEHRRGLLKADGLARDIKHAYRGRVNAEDLEQVSEVKANTRSKRHGTPVANEYFTGANRKFRGIKSGEKKARREAERAAKEAEMEEKRRQDAFEHSLKSDLSDIDNLVAATTLTRRENRAENKAAKKKAKAKAKTARKVERERTAAGLPFSNKKAAKANSKKAVETPAPVADAKTEGTEAPKAEKKKFRTKVREFFLGPKIEKAAKPEAKKSDETRIRVDEALEAKQKAEKEAAEKKANEPKKTRRQRIREFFLGPSLKKDVKDADKKEETEKTETEKKDAEVAAKPTKEQINKARADAYVAEGKAREDAEKKYAEILKIENDKIAEAKKILKATKDPAERAAAKKAIKDAKKAKRQARRDRRILRRQAKRDRKQAIKNAKRGIFAPAKEKSTAVRVDEKLELQQRLEAERFAHDERNEKEWQAYVLAEEQKLAEMQAKRAAAEERAKAEKAAKEAAATAADTATEEKKEEKSKSTAIRVDEALEAKQKAEKAAKEAAEAAVVTLADVDAKKDAEEKEKAEVERGIRAWLGRRVANHRARKAQRQQGRDRGDGEAGQGSAEPATEYKSAEKVDQLPNGLNMTTR